MGYRADGSELTVKNMLDGMELPNHPLEPVYDTIAADLKRRAARINKHKSMPRKRTVAKGARP